MASAWPFWPIWFNTLSNVIYVNLMLHWFSFVAPCFWFYVGVFASLMARDGILKVHELAKQEIQR
jgi:hypothetical protein